MFYIFHGDDAFSIGETVRGLRQRLIDADPMAELNYAELEGRVLAPADLRTAVDTLPFLGDRRVVVVHGLLTRCNPRGGEAEGRKGLADAIIGLLPAMPPTTRLVLVDGALHANNPVLRWAAQWRAAQPVPDAAAVIRAFEPPKLDRLPQWLTTRAQHRGGAIAPPAAAALADALARDGEVDLRQADNELEKLLTYAGGRPVTAADVADLVTSVTLESIFRWVDALGERDGPQAATLLHRFLANDEPPLRLLALIVRQFRLLLHTRALMDAGVPAGEMPGRVGVPPFVARKLTGQARRFTPRFLEAALRRLIEIDTQIKTGRLDGVLALDLFVAGVCGTRGGGGGR